MDNRQDYGEQRLQLIGCVESTFIIVFVAYTHRGQKIRLISARKANKKERAIYEQNYRNRE